MKHLWVLRHAKAEAGEQGQRDIDRELTGRGRRQADWLRSEGVLGAVANGAALPELVLVSTSARTRQTAALVEGALAGARIEQESDLYLADADQVVDRLRLLDDAVGSAMVVGHNPSMHELALLLLADPPDHGPPGDGFPTACMAVLALDIQSWAGVGDHGARLVSVAVPRR